MFGGGGDVLLVVRRVWLRVKDGPNCCAVVERGEWGDVRLVLARYENRKIYG